MKPTLLAAILLTAGGLAACTGPTTTYDIDRTTVNGLPSVVAVGSTRAQAKVVAIDYATRSIALEGQDGTTQIFHINSAVRNFYQVKKGDTVRLDYYNRLAVNVRKTSDVPQTTVVEAVELADLGQKPGIVCSRKAQIEATVHAIDYTTRAVTLKKTDGSTISLTAHKNLKNLESVHQGDMVVFDYSEVVSIQVD